MATYVDNTDNTDSVQGLVVINCTQNTSDIHLIKKISNHFNETTDQYKDNEPKSLNFGLNFNVDGFDLKIDNKYYSANIFLFDIKDKNLFSERLAESVNGVIVYFDSNESKFCPKDSSFDEIKSWLSYINQFDNEIKLLVCQTIDDIKQQFIEKWCLENEFELVELLPQTDGNQHELDVHGITRIVDAIQAYHWPYSSLKERPQYKPSDYFKNLIEKEISNVSQQNNDKPINLSDQLSDNQEIEDLEEFNDLFEKFSEIKIKSSQMSETEKKDYAERVTIAFWKAIGGDIKEIEGLEDDADN